MEPENYCILSFDIYFAIWKVLNIFDSKLSQVKSYFIKKRRSVIDETLFFSDSGLFFN